MFKPGEVVKKKSGVPFYGGHKTAVVIPVPDHHECDDWAHHPKRAWINVPNLGSAWCGTSELERASPEPIYEDEWTMWKEGMEVPPDADVARSEKGNVVCFRRVKKPKIREAVRFFEIVSADIGVAYATTRTPRHTHKLTITLVDDVPTESRIEKL